MLSLARMRRIRAVDPLNYTMIAEAGCVLAEVQAAAASVDRLFPMSLGSEGSCQLGGNLSTNAGGTAVLRYGMMRDLVLGLEVVLPDGRVLDGLKPLRKDNTGYDLRDLFIGAEGTLGIITAAACKLFSRPASTRDCLRRHQPIRRQAVVIAVAAAHFHRRCRVDLRAHAAHRARVGAASTCRARPIRSISSHRLVRAAGNRHGPAATTPRRESIEAELAAAHGGRPDQRRRARHQRRPARDVLAPARNHSRSPAPRSAPASSTTFRSRPASCRTSSSRRPRAAHAIAPTGRDRFLRPPGRRQPAFQRQPAARTATMSRSCAWRRTSTARCTTWSPAMAAASAPSTASAGSSATDLVRYKHPSRSR